MNKEQEKLLQLLNPSQYEDFVGSDETAYEMDVNNKIIGVTVEFDDLHIELTQDETVKTGNVYTYFVESSVNGKSSTLSFEFTMNDNIELQLQNKLHELGSIFPFGTGLINNIGKFFKPYKNEYIPNLDITLNMLLFFEQKNITSKSSFEEIKQAYNEYLEIKL